MRQQQGWLATMVFFLQLTRRVEQQIDLSVTEILRLDVIPTLKACHLALTSKNASRQGAEAQRNSPNNSLRLRAFA